MTFTRIAKHVAPLAFATIASAAAMQIGPSFGQETIELGVLANAAFTPEAPIPETGEAYEKAWAAFEAENPTIKLKAVPIVGNTDAIQEVLAKGAAGQLPDVGIVDTGWLARLQHSGYLQPLDGVLTADDESDFLAGVLESGTLDGKLRAIPFYNAWRGLFYRPSELKKLGYDAPPTDWNEFLKFGEVARKNGFQYSIMFPATMSEFTAVILLPIYFGLGGKLFDADGAPVFFDSPNREILERVLGLWRDLVVSGDTTDQIGSMDEAALKPYFYSRQTVTVSASSSNVAQMLIDDPSLVGDLAAAPLPVPDGGKPVPLLQNWAYVIFTTDPVRQEAAKKFVQYIVSTQVQGPLNGVDRRLPVRKSIWDGESFYVNDPLMRQVYEIQIDPRMRLHSSIRRSTRHSVTPSPKRRQGHRRDRTPAEAVDKAKEATLAALSRL